ncbi:hypothetical protein OF829_06445 [Sphingomonas sp. LB-2]|uniref:hypothetical protein n=1 Tax=Sphingomonas caeni TaxID=2984949 RepID=UPI0022308186|nr:hypothetical protein [Sphingomonas caeni]MCW3846873.1 hypothetical protein [Sphingomonas caeni]
MMRVTIAVGLAALLAGCGGGGTAAQGGNASAAPSLASAAAVAGGVEGSNDCAKKPDFAPIYAGGVIKVCSSAHFDAPAKTAGTVSYTTPAAPAAVLAWSREQAGKAGLGERLATDKMFSAGEGTKRTLMVMALPDGSGSRVTVNWGKAD